VESGETGSDRVNRMNRIGKKKFASCQETVGVFG
jgi:hypothetical protein